METSDNHDRRYAGLYAYIACAKRILRVRIHFIIAKIINSTHSRQWCGSPTQSLSVSPIRMRRCRTLPHMAMKMWCEQIRTQVHDEIKSKAVTRRESATDSERARVNGEEKNMIQTEIICFSSFYTYELGTTEQACSTDRERERDRTSELLAYFVHKKQTNRYESLAISLREHAANFFFCLENTLDVPISAQCERYSFALEVKGCWRMNDKIPLSESHAVSLRTSRVWPIPGKASSTKNTASADRFRESKLN